MKFYTEDGNSFDTLEGAIKAEEKNLLGLTDKDIIDYAEYKREDNRPTIYCGKMDDESEIGKDYDVVWQLGRDTLAYLKAKLHFGDYEDVELYVPMTATYNCSFHTDKIRSIEDYEASILDQVVQYEVMNESRYNNTILANCSIDADFGEWYDDDNAEVLCIIVDTGAIERSAEVVASGLE